MPINDTIQAQLQRNLADHLKQAKWIEEEYARRQAEPDEPVKPVQRKRSPRNQPISKQDAQPLKEDAALQNFFASQPSLRRFRYKSMESEIEKLKREVRDTLLTAPMLEMAKIALPNLEKMTTWKGYTGLLQNLLAAASAPANAGTSKRAGSTPGRKPMTKAHNTLADIVEPHGVEWKRPKNLKKICADADRRRVPVSAQWHAATTWKGGLKKHPERVVKLIESRLKSIVRLP